MALEKESLGRLKEWFGKGNGDGNGLVMEMKSGNRDIFDENKRRSGLWPSVLLLSTA